MQSRSEKNDVGKSAGESILLPRFAVLGSFSPVQLASEILAEGVENLSATQDSPLGRWLRPIMEAKVVVDAGFAAPIAIDIPKLRSEGVVELGGDSYVNRSGETAPEGHVDPEPVKDPAKVAHAQQVLAEWRAMREQLPAPETNPRECSQEQLVDAWILSERLTAVQSELPWQETSKLWQQGTDLRRAAWDRAASGEDLEAVLKDRESRIPKEEPRLRDEIEDWRQSAAEAARERAAFKATRALATGSMNSLDDVVTAAKKFAATPDDPHGDAEKAAALASWLDTRLAGRAQALGRTLFDSNDPNAVAQVQKAIDALSNLAAGQFSDTKKMLRRIFDRLKRGPEKAEGFSRPTSAKALVESLVDRFGPTGSTPDESLSGDAIYSDLKKVVRPKARWRYTQDEYMRSMADIAKSRPAGSISTVQARGFAWGAADGTPIGKFVEAALGEPTPGRAADNESAVYRFLREKETKEIPRGRLYLSVDNDYGPDVVKHLVENVIDDPARFPGVELVKIIGGTEIVVYTKDASASERVIAALGEYQAEHPGQFVDAGPPLTQRRLPGIFGFELPEEVAGDSMTGVFAHNVKWAMDAGLDQGWDRERIVQEALNNLARLGVDVSN